MPEMTKNFSSIAAQGGEVLKKVKKSEHDNTLNFEESKLDPHLVSGHSTFKAERGLIR